MHWTDDAIVLGAKRHGETSAILDVMTRAHGRHLGLVRGGAGSRLKAILQPGNGLSVSWRARLDEHLGHYTVEPLKLRAADYFGAPYSVYGVGHLAALMRLLPERDPHPALYDPFEVLLENLTDAQAAAPLVVRFELQLLAELGFGLDLAECAATGATDDLVYVSPKSGRAVSRDAGEPYANRMLRLPAFLRDAQETAGAEALAEGFALTGFFLERYVMEPRGLALGDERAHFIAALQRAGKRLA